MDKGLNSQGGQVSVIDTTRKSPPTTVNGILAQGKIENPDANNGCGWADLAVVVTAMESGDTYVNVHTLQNPGGEIRGQIR